MAKTALLFNYEYCSGCKSCEIACRNHLRLGLGQWGMKVAEVKPFEVGDGNKMEWIYQPVPTKLCDGCEDRVAAGRSPRASITAWHSASSTGRLRTWPPAQRNWAAA